jgi:hypothetical protein
VGRHVDAESAVQFAVEPVEPVVERAWLVQKRFDTPRGGGRRRQAAVTLKVGIDPRPGTSKANET